MTSTATNLFKKFTDGFESNSCLDKAESEVGFYDFNNCYYVITRRILDEINVQNNYNLSLIIGETAHYSNYITHSFLMNVGLFDFTLGPLYFLFFLI
jgi:hypothetical protein